jgi:hypothetical protein
MSDEREPTESADAELPPPPPPLAAPPAATEWTMSVAIGIMQLAGLASIGAGAIHAGAAGLHAEHTTLARLFVAVAVAQIGVGLLALVRGGRLAAATTALVNLGAVAAWGASRLWGISWIDGLEVAEDPQFTDTACATLGAIAAVAAIIALVRGRTVVSTVRLGLPAFSVGVVTLAAMLLGANHTHSHGDEQAVASGAGAPVAADGHSHSHGDEDAAASGAGAPVAVADEPVDWPRPWDPAVPVDLSGVAGVTPEQELRATALVQNTLRELPAFADVDTLDELGYRSIGDSRTGYEHFINYSLINDDVILDPTQPESLVFRVDGAERTLVSAMFIAGQRPIDDAELVDYGGRLMQWHVHRNLCWAGGDNGPRVVAVTDAEGNCPPGSVHAGGDNPMVHVWIVAHECGPFAALEGHGAGQVAAGSGARTDQCAHDDGTGSGHSHDAGADPDTVSAIDAANDDAAAAPAPVPFDPEAPIDLSGTPGVTSQQQAFAENLVSSTLRDLPQWADPAVAENAGFHSIGDSATGYEHYVQWDWIDDDVWLDPDHPESLVYRVEPDGSRTLVSAMFMLPNSMSLDEVPDWGGALMQWHVHSDLCFDVSDPEAPRVGGLTDDAGECTAPLTRLGESPMIHVWIVPHECGPFAALEGVAAGQVPAGEEHLCDHAHGSTD